MRKAYSRVGDLEVQGTFGDLGKDRMVVCKKIFAGVSRL
jgi:hypothetical protein